MSNTHRTSRTRNSQEIPQEPEEEEAEIEEEPEETEPESEETEQETRHRKKGDSREGSGTSRKGGDRSPTPMEVLRQARAQLAELTGLVPESVSSFEQTEDGWSLEVEVLELSRVPDTMSLMGGYQVELDPEGQLTGYRRVRRYERGRADPRAGR
ncbi:gas vesicle protein [Streptomyces sp. NEAU-sy36]|uniref:gas vesicle protein GvpO n=1 Tax=unclassified Streptomyces TaxID=2593676 RepID=UPI0015D5DF4E|nr:gas vesicle protein [Streptomyces sp. NEAU-sy36]